MIGRGWAAFANSVAEIESVLLKLTMPLLRDFVKQAQTQLGLENLYVQVDITGDRSALLDFFLASRSVSH